MTQPDDKGTVSKLRTQMFTEWYFIYTQLKSLTLPF